ncbi:MAG: DUF192 domain-containing protein [Pseudomonadota bacterium]
MNKIWILALTFLLIGCLPEENVEADAPTQLTIQTKTGALHQFDVELALKPSDFAQGLMFRNEMAENAGMLFYFGGREAERRFWMKNTFIPLDMIFIRKNGDIHHIHENAQPNDLTRIGSQGPVAAVLEINGGISSSLGIRKGDKIIHPFFADESVE